MKPRFNSRDGTVEHRGLKLDGAIGQGEICNSLKSENFSKSFLSHIKKKKKKFKKKKKKNDKGPL